MILLSTAALLVMTRLLVGEREGRTRTLDEWGLGVLIGLALLAKTNAAFLLPLAFGVIAWRARGQGGVKAALAGWLRVGVPVIVPVLESITSPAGRFGVTLNTVAKPSRIGSLVAIGEQAS